MYLMLICTMFFFKIYFNSQNYIITENLEKQYVIRKVKFNWVKEDGVKMVELLPQHISGMKVIFPNVFFDDALVGVLEFNVGQNLS